MSLEPEMRIGGYTVVREIGRGGMGIGYLGRDTRLDRDVAIKGLPEEVAGDAVRLSRFEREAKTLAQVSHPNIAGIYGVEEHEGRKFLVLELVEGETLADRLDRGRLALDEAIEIAAQIAEGLEAAHEAGVIHRDLKPGNVMITPEGRVKVLDFGLARAEEGSSSTSLGGDAPTVSSPVAHSPTIPGAILGTAPYMSPEQARGRRVDKRTDVWSFGVMLDEMLTGASPFVGETPTDSLGAVLHKDVDLERLPPETPPMVRHVLRRCLARDKGLRYRDIGDARIELMDAGVGVVDSPTAAGGKGGRAGMALAAVAAAVVMGAAGVLIGRSLAPVGSGTVEPVRFSVVLPEGKRLTGALSQNVVAVSPDGRHMALVLWSESEGRASLYVRSQNDFELRRVEGAVDPRGPCFSPDGEWIAFVEGFNRLVRTRVSGGPIETVVDFSDRSMSVEGPMRWLPSNELLLSSEFGDRLERVDMARGTMEPFLRSDPARGFYGFFGAVETPEPSGALIHTWDGPRRSSSSVAWLDLESGEVTPLIRNAAHPHVVGDRWVTFLRDHSIYATEFNFKRKEPVGEPRLIIDEVRTESWSTHATQSASNSGVVVYQPGRREGEGRRIVLADRGGTMQRVVDREGVFMDSPALSKDGRLLAYTTLNDAVELWVHDRTTGSTDRFDVSGEVYAPLFSPDGRWLYFLTVEHGVEHLDRLNLRTRQVERLLEDRPASPESWTADGKLIATLRKIDANDWDVVALDVTSGDLTPQMIRDSPYPEWGGQVSPDGEWLLYNTFRSGREEIYVRRLEDAGREWLVASNQVSDALWSVDGSAIHYLSDRTTAGLFERSFEVSDDGDSVRLGEERLLFESPSLGIISNYQVAPDGRVLMMQAADWDLAGAPLRVIMHWDREIERAFEGTAPGRR
ncbi:MAG: protein kinase [Planctomycetota bacterium]|nr:protein kinase [Planctomycetota bacterium]